ncbi:MAG: hypothetical protein VX733_14325 [Candidatus Latescibacterota bacterium]|nr:hypothetical protein [Candidatus Latescibacterota bacterium]
MSVHRWLQAGVTFLLLAQGALAQSGHLITGDEVVVITRSHWSNWEFPAGTVNITSRGNVLANRVRTNIDATRDIEDWLRLHPRSEIGNKDSEEITLADAIISGSNAQDVQNLFDGDLTTYWQPDKASPDLDLGSQWWFMLDLGRLTFANKIVLKFVDEELGDPFLLFDVLISDGLRPTRVQSLATPGFTTVLRTLQPNKSQRVFSLDLSGNQIVVEGSAKSAGSTQDMAPESTALRARPVRWVQVIVNGSDTNRARQVNAEEYADLPTDQRGDVVFNKLLPDGSEVPVAQAVHELLDDDRQGEVLYFRTERPRLAELEVWTEGDELISGILARDGVISTTAQQTLALANFIDGSLDSFNDVFHGTVSAVAEPETELRFDLGSFYWLTANRMAYAANTASGRFGVFGKYNIDVSDGSRAADGSLSWQRMFERDPNAVVVLDGDYFASENNFEANRFDLVKARFLRVQWTLTSGAARVAKLAEVQAYGQGYQPEISMESDLIRLGGSRNLVSVEWEAKRPPGTDVLIQTRTGDELDEVLHYFHKDGREVTEVQYGRLLSIFKGDITSEEVPGGDWSSWSQPYDDPTGSPIISPSPREFVKVRATLLSDRLDTSATLNSIRLHFASPVAQMLTAEIDPVEVDSLGVPRPFSLFVRPDFNRTSPGFDELLLVGSPEMQIEFDAVYAGSEEGVAALDPDTWLSATAVGEVGDSLHVVIDNQVRPNTGIELVRLNFRTALFSAGTELRAAARSGDEPWQWVSAGDAASAADGNATTLVGVVEYKSLIHNLEVLPPAFSPNGDAINDEVRFEFTVLLVDGDNLVAVEIHDLSGRQLRRLVDRRSVSAGDYSIPWDGRDEAGELTPPGLYVAQVEVDADVEGANIDRSSLITTFAVVY